MQASIDRLSGTFDNFCLTISTTKTEVMYQPYPCKQPCTLPWHTQHQSKLTYLGSTLSCQATIDEEVKYRIAKASNAFGRLGTHVWERRSISLGTKLKVYQVVIITTLLCACESGTVYRRHTRQLNHFHTSKMMRIKWQDESLTQR